MMDKDVILKNIERPFGLIRCDDCRKVYVMWKDVNDRGEEQPIWPWSDSRGCPNCGGVRYRTGPGVRLGFWRRLWMSYYPVTRMKFFYYQELWREWLEKRDEFDKQQEQLKKDLIRG